MMRLIHKLAGAVTTGISKVRTKPCLTLVVTTNSRTCASVEELSTCGYGRSCCATRIRRGELGVKSLKSGLRILIIK